MEDLDKYVEERIKQKEAENNANEELRSNDSSNATPLTEEQKYRIEKEAQANTVFEKATKDPKALVKAQISQGAVTLINEDEDFKGQINEASKNTVKSAIKEVDGDNRKSDNASFYSGREEAINAMGGGSDTAQHKQKYMNVIYNAWWYIIMTILGIFFIAPLRVLMNWGLALSPEQIKKTTTNGNEVVEKTKKMHWLAGVFACVFYIVYLIGLAFLIIWIVRMVIK